MDDSLTKLERFVASFRAIVEEPLDTLKATIEAQDALSDRWLLHINHQCRLFGSLLKQG
jgi:hypothetical protein